MTKPTTDDARAPLDLDFAMTEDERRSPLWQKIFMAAEARIWKLRESNDKAMEPEKTQAIRNEIKFLKGILKNDPSREFNTPPSKVVTIEELDAG